MVSTAVVSILTTHVVSQIFIIETKYGKHAWCEKKKRDIDDFATCAMRMSRVCLFFSPRSAAIILGVAGMAITVVANYLTTCLLWIGIPAVGSLAFQHHEPAAHLRRRHNLKLASDVSTVLLFKNTTGGNRSSSDGVDVITPSSSSAAAAEVSVIHSLYSNLGCGRHEARSVHKVLVDADLERLMSPWQLWAVDRCAALLPWYKAYWRAHVALHCCACAMLARGAYLYRRRLLLPWLALESAALLGHVLVGGTVLAHFLSPSAYRLAASSAWDRSRSVSAKVARDWAIYLAHVPWRAFWITAVLSLYQELYLVNDGAYWGKKTSEVNVGTPGRKLE